MSRRPLPWQAQGALLPAPALVSVVSLQNVDLILSIALTLFGIAVVAALAVAFWRELANDTITISPIYVPRDLADRGYEPQVVAARLLDAYRELHAESGVPFLPRRPQRAAGEPDIQLPGGRTSMRGIVRYLRRLFGRPAAEVDGEITREGDAYVMRLRFRGVRIVPIEGERAPSLDLASVLRGGAEDLMLMTDPGTLGLRLLQVEPAERKFDVSERAFERAVHGDAAIDRARGFLGYARIREHQGRVTEAEGYFRQGLAQGAASPQLLHAFLLLLLNQDRVDDAIVEATRFAANATSTEQRVGGAVALINVRRNTEALSILDSLLRRDPRNGVLHQARGRALSGLYRWPAAVKAFERATELEPWVFNWRQYHAWALAQAGRTDDALAIVRPIAHRHNGDEWGQHCLGVAELEAGNLDRALAALAISYASTPARASAAGQYARALVAAGRAAEAESVIAPIRRHPAMSPRIPWVEGLVHEALGRDEAALASFEAGIAGDPLDPAPRFAAAALLSRLGRADDAQQARDEAAAVAARNAAFA